jgi:hypothetical protein
MRHYEVIDLDITGYNTVDARIAKLKETVIRYVQPGSGDNCHAALTQGRPADPELSFK